jgi:hypothetical protein
MVATHADSALADVMAVPDRLSTRDERDQGMVSDGAAAPVGGPAAETAPPTFDISVASEPHSPSS